MDIHPISTFKFSQGSATGADGSIKPGLVINFHMRNCRRHTNLMVALHVGLVLHSELLGIDEVVGCHTSRQSERGTKDSLMRRETRPVRVSVLAFYAPPNKHLELVVVLKISQSFSCKFNLAFQDASHSLGPPVLPRSVSVGNLLENTIGFQTRFEVSLKLLATIVD